MNLRLTTLLLTLLSTAASAASYQFWKTAPGMQGGGNQIATAKACQTPWGASLADGQSVTAYQLATVSVGETCQSEVRECRNGVLTNSYTAPDCQVQADTSSWSALALPTLVSGQAGWRAITAANNKFYLTSATATNLMASSTDGVNWSTVTLPSSGQWQNVFYAKGAYYVFPYTGSNMAYSTDGTNFVLKSVPTGAGSWMSMATNGSRIVAIARGSGSSLGAYSDDGLTWTAFTLPVGTNWMAVAYGNGVFAAISYTGNAYAYSTDGATWTGGTMPVTANWDKLVFGGGKFVASSYSGANMAYSTDGATWYSSTTVAGKTRYWYSLTYGSGQFAAVQTDGTVITSPDGINWTNHTLPGSGMWYATAYANGRFVGVANNAMSGVISN